MLKRAGIASLLLLYTCQTALANSEPPCNNEVDSAMFLADPQGSAWKWFACLNKQTNDKATWESFKPVEQVYLSNGEVPKSYDYIAPLPPEVISKAEEAKMNLNEIFHDIQLKVQVDGLALEMGSASPFPTTTLVRYQLLMNESTFDYINSKKVYNLNGISALQDDLNFPSSAWELKTSWLWIGQELEFRIALQNDGYKIVQAYYLDDNNEYQVGYAALSGMHIINKTFSEDWIWATFENINNSKYTITNGFPAQPMHNLTGPTELATKANNTFQKEFASLGLSEYQLIGVQNGFVERPTNLLASSQMESAFQTKSSCVACHQTAAYSNEKGFFSFALADNDGIAYPLEKIPDSDFTGYKKLDFVWSLKRAQWNRSQEGTN